MSDKNVLPHTYASITKSSFVSHREIPGVVKKIAIKPIINLPSKQRCAPTYRLFPFFVI